MLQYKSVNNTISLSRQEQVCLSEQVCLNVNVC